MKPLLSVVFSGLFLVGGASAFADSDATFVYPTGYALLDGTGATLVHPVDNPLIPTAEGTLINQVDAVYVPTSAPLLNPFATPLVPTGVPSAGH